MTDQRTPAQLYALVIGATLLAAGIIGFFYNSSFDTGDDASRDAVFGILDVNAWHNIVHLASGLVGLAVFKSAAGARSYALIFGLVYLLVTIYGFAMGDGEVLLGLIPVNTEDNILHLLISLAGLGAYAASSDKSSRPAHA